MSLGSAVFSGSSFTQRWLKMLSGRVVFMFFFFLFYNWQGDASAPVITTLSSLSEGETDIWMDGWRSNRSADGDARKQLKVAFLFRLGWIYQWEAQEVQLLTSTSTTLCSGRGNKGELSPIMKTILMLINSQLPPSAPTSAHPHLQQIHLHHHLWEPS